MAKEGKIVGFVPTMGALHQGHLSLAEKAAEDCDEIITSIFVNPTQFGPGEDLGRYPRDLEGDIKKLRSVPKVTTVFQPDPEEMYPEETHIYVTLDSLEERLREGRSRPGHFKGVATVVTKLFNIVQPHKAYFGQKDGGQCIVIKRLVQELLINTEIKLVPTLREKDGLAMSSRNAYITPQERPHATVLYKALQELHNLFVNGERKAEKLLQCGIGIISANQNVRIIYLDLCCSHTAKQFQGSDVIPKGVKVMASGAIMLGKTRLIDNILLEA
uniref:Pantoate--beta-alanine ligase n=1 Tax=Amorphochlora amoebiformis TaxID=1561963 RepID=A0A6T6U234_9EUKA